MAISQFLIRTLLLAAGILCSSICFSQRRVIEMKDSTGLHSYSVVRGDTVVIRYDSAYVLNKKMFRLFQDNYKRVQNGNPSLKRLLEDYENLIALQDSMLKAKEMYYQQIKSNMDSLLSNSNRFVDKTTTNIQAIDQSLANATNQLNNIKLLLDNSLEELKRQNRNKIKIAVGGFAVGVGVTALIFLINK